MKKGITIVFAANIINMIFSIITSFILPKYLSLESYGYYKVFQLYVGYLGIAHLGFVDGVYLRYGGKDVKSIEANEILDSEATIRNMQIALTTAAAAVSWAIGSPIAILLALTCLPVNMVSFYKNLFQATGEFKDYGIVLSMLSMLTFICDVGLLFVFKTDNYIAYILVVFLSYLFLYVLLEYKCSKAFGRVRLFVFNWRLFKENIVSGITLTIGNFSSIMITGIDRWCVQAWMAISDFSYYSFAVSVENLFNVCVSAVTVTLYNYLCKVKDLKRIIRIKTYCIFIGIYLVAVAFPVKFIIQLCLIKYEQSINCLFILLCSHLFYFVTKAIYVNLYKARGQQKHYFHQMLMIVFIAAVTNVLAYYVISRTKESFAYASLLTAIIWYFICFREFKEIKGEVQETILLLACSGIYLVCGLFFENAIFGFGIYIFAVTICAFGLNRGDFLTFIQKSFNYAR